MTEDEAKTKWCPFQETAEFHGVMQSILREVTPRQTGEGRVYFSGSVGDLPPRARCIASECMMWRTDKCGLADHGSFSIITTMGGSGGSSYGAK